MTRGRISTWVYAIIALLLTVPATAAIARADAGLFRADYVVSGVPLTVIAPDDESDRPAVVVVHGFAGSSTIMDPLAVALARAGYRVVVPDLHGHGSNTEALPLLPDGRGDPQALQNDIDIAVTWIAAQHGVKTDQIGLVGHSMGAGAVVRFGIADAQGAKRIRATVALSLPSAADVPQGQPAVPRNLLLMWGAAEPASFQTAGEEALHAAYPDGVVGQSYGSGADGTARGTSVVPGVEHIGIVFSPVTSQATVDWLDSTVAVGSSGHTAPSDPRLLWLLVLLAGAVVGFVPLARLAFGTIAQPEPSSRAPILRARWVIPVAIASMLAASLIALAIPDNSHVLPLSVADYTVVWFALAGVMGGVLVTLLTRRRASSDGGSDAAQPDEQREVKGVGRQVVATLALTAYLVAVLALASQHTWSDFAISGPRVWVLPMVEVAMIAFFWADERMVARPSRTRRALFVVANRVILLVMLIVAVVAFGAPGVLTLWVPLLLVLLVPLGVCAHVVAGITRERWAPALLQAIPLAYVIASAFPIVSG